MSEPSKTVKVNFKKKNLFVTDKESLDKLSKEELIEKFMKLEQYNCHLKNTIKKNKEESSSETSKTTRKIIDFDAVPKRHVFLKFFYFGWDFEGFVTQDNTNNTVEDHLMNALQKCNLIESMKKCNYQRCGRTDKGVSAFSQVVSLDLRSKLQVPTSENVKDEYPYCSMVNRVLPKQIKCYAWAHVNSNTSARFNCSSRTYKYYFPKGNLDIDMMLKSAKLLLGSHDFRNFCKMDVGNGVVEFMRNIKFVDIRPCSSVGSETSGYQMFELVIQGNAFLYHQIRCIMSVLFLIGQGKESPDIISHLLNVEQNPCKPQYSLADPLPLNLFDVEYEDVVNGWNIDEEALIKIMRFLQSQWTKYHIKCTMIRDIMGSLENLGSSPIILENQPESLILDTKRKSYRPLSLREKCDSLEEKIKHYAKKGRIEVST